MLDLFPRSFKELLVNKIWLTSLPTSLFHSDTIHDELRHEEEKKERNSLPKMHKRETSGFLIVPKGRFYPIGQIQRF